MPLACSLDGFRRGTREVRDTYRPCAHITSVPARTCSLKAVEVIFRLTAATLTRRAPEQGTFVLTDLSATRGPEAVLNVVRLLDRLDALESDPLREESRDDDHAALEALEPRGLGKKERGELRAQCERVARSTSTGLAKESTARGSRIARLTRLRGWYDEWAGLSRAVITKPAHLVALGLSGRSSTEST